MENLNDYFIKAFEELRKTGKGLSGIASKEFVPAGIREDVKDPGPFYHGPKKYKKEAAKNKRNES